jgi:hypothetical protein
LQCWERKSKLLCFCVGLEKLFDVNEEFILNSPKRYTAPVRRKSSSC